MLYTTAANRHLACVCCAWRATPPKKRAHGARPPTVATAARPDCTRAAAPLQASSRAGGPPRVPALARPRASRAWRTVIVRSPRAGGRQRPLTLAVWSGTAPDAAGRGAVSVSASGGCPAVRAVALARRAVAPWEGGGSARGLARGQASEGAEGGCHFGRCCAFSECSPFPCSLHSLTLFAAPHHHG